MRVKIQTEDFDLSREIATLRQGHPEVGAIVSFVGVVRDFNGGDHVNQLCLEHYPGMTEKSIESIMTSAHERWQLVDCLVIHRVGLLMPLDQIVLVVVMSAHRGDAFAGCEFIMDYLKTQAPFWKKEKTPQGAHWVEAKQSDDEAAQRWSQSVPRL